MREWLGPDHPVVRQVFGKDSPDTLAERVVRQSTLGNAAARMALYEGGQAAIDASSDPMIRLAAAVDPAARALRKTFETEVEGPVARGQEAIAKARFAEYGTSIYPDATFTLRLSYGAMQGWVEKGEEVRPWTELSRAFERATGEPPFRIPDSWLAVKDRARPDDAGEFHHQQRHRRRQLGQPDARTRPVKSSGSPSTATSTRSPAATGSTSGSTARSACTRRSSARRSRKSTAPARCSRRSTGAEPA